MSDEITSPFSESDIFLSQIRMTTL